MNMNFFSFFFFVELELSQVVHGLRKTKKTVDMHANLFRPASGFSVLGWLLPKYRFAKDLFTQKRLIRMVSGVRTLQTMFFFFYLYFTMCYFIFLFGFQKHVKASYI